MKRPWPLTLLLATVFLALSRAALAQDFTLVLTPAAAGVEVSKGATIRSTITATGGFPGDIKIDKVTPPTGITGIKNILWSPTAFYAPVGSVSLSFDVDPSLPWGRYTIVVTGIGCVTSNNCSGPTHTASFELTIFLALANRVFVSARSGNNANACDNILTPCQTFAGAVTQLNPNGEVIVLDSGGYGPMTITQGVTIEAPAGVTAFIHPPSGDAITVNAGSGTVTLRGLTLNVGTGNGITVNSVGTLNVENCFITGFANRGIEMLTAGRLNVKGTDIKGCTVGVRLATTTGAVLASIDHCHLDGNLFGFASVTTGPGTSTTTATYSTADGNSASGWICGDSTDGQDVLNLEFCTGSDNGSVGLIGGSGNAQSVARYSNCVFANNAVYGVQRFGTGTFETRGNNTITGNGTAPTNGVIGPFSPM